MFFSSCSFNYLDYEKHIKSPDSEFNYCLYSVGIGISDPEFVVLKIEDSINPREIEIDWNPRSGVARKDISWIDDREILANYDEASYLCRNPGLELIDNRYLVLSRGGYYFGLYDLTLQRDIFNRCCPFNDWVSQNIWTEKGAKYDGEIEKDAKSDYEIWVKKTIHDSIVDYINTNRLN